MPKLTQKQKLFCLEYMIDFNGTQAAIRAGYSKKTSGKIGSENLKKPDIQAFLKKKVKRVTDKLEITVERILEEQARLAFVNIADLFDEDGKLIPIQDLPEDVSRAISSLQVEEIYEYNDDDEPEELTKKFKYKLNDKKEALAKLMQFKGMLINKNEHSGPDGGPIPIKSEHDLSKLTLKELKELDRITEKASAAEPN